MSAPKAKIGDGPTILRYAWTRLDGSTSEGDDLTYRWKVISANTESCQLLEPTLPVARFSASAAGTYVVQLTVTAGDQKDAEVVIIEVTQFEARIVGSPEGERYGSIPLDGSGSIAPVGATFVWSVDSANAQVIVDSSDVKKAFLVPEEVGHYRVTLRCTADLSGETGPELRSVEASHDVTVREGIVSGGEADELFWRDQLKDHRNKAIDDVKASAVKWEASITAFLTLFAAVTFVTGPKALSDVSSDGAAKFALVLVGIAFVVAFIARVNLADVANGTPIFGDALTPLEYRAAVWESAKTGAAKLRRSRSLAIAATLLVACGSLMLAFASLDKAPPAKPQVLARTLDETRCGVLSTDSSGTVSVAGSPIGATEEIAIVANCNPPPAAEAGKAATVPSAILLVVLALVGLLVGVWTSRMSILAPAVSAIAVFIGGAVWYRSDVGVNLSKDWSKTWSIPATVVVSVTLGYLSDYLPRRKHVT